MATVAIQRKGSEVSIKDVALKLVFRDQSFLVVDKEPDLRIDGDIADTLEKQIHRDAPMLEGQKLRLTHQLDYATSGIMCYGLTKKAAGEACRLFRERLAEKVYSAIVYGCATFQEKIVTDSIADYLPPNEDDRIIPMSGGQRDFRQCIGTKDNPGKPAETKIVVQSVGLFLGVPVTHVLLFPKTGRRHQLRLHLANLGHPIVGDSTYTALPFAKLSEDDVAAAAKLCSDTPFGPLEFSTTDPFRGVLSEESVNRSGQKRRASDLDE